MKYFPVFLSLVFVVRNCSSELEKILTETTAFLSSFVKDYELIIVDNASRDTSISVLKKLTGEEGLCNLRVYALAKEVDIYTASWVGIENALGDFVAVLDPFIEDIHFLPETLNEATMKEADVVFVQNKQKPSQGVVYRIAYSIFNIVYRYFHGIHLATEAPQFRLLNKRVIHFILQHPQPAVAYQYLPATSGFSCVKLSYSATPSAVPSKRLGDSIDRGIQLLVSTSRAPLRIVTGLSLCGAVLNLIYSIYVVVIFFFKPHVAGQPH